MVDGWWLMVDGWWLMGIGDWGLGILVDGWWLLVEGDWGFWLMVGGWWLVVDGWWFLDCHTPKVPSRGQYAEIGLFRRDLRFLSSKFFLFLLILFSVGGF